MSHTVLGEEKAELLYKLIDAPIHNELLLCNGALKKISHIEEKINKQNLKFLRKGLEKRLQRREGSRVWKTFYGISRTINFAEERPLVFELLTF